MYQTSLFRPESRRVGIPVGTSRLYGQSNSIEKKLKEDVITDYHMLDEKTVDKIDKMCINNVQMKFFSVKSEDN
jgi:hypothetical protein